MRLETIHEHTVDLDRLVTGGWVLDAGCRNFAFTREMVKHGMLVVAVDPDPEVHDPLIDGITFENLAVAASTETRELVLTDDVQARHLRDAGGLSTVKIMAVPVEHLMVRYSVSRWAAVKLDVEGEEYSILRAWPGPIAEQISIEFHEHCCPQPQVVYDEIFQHLGQWYDVVQHVKEARYCAAPNYWDTLLVRRA